jgi:hypothetical protein
MPDGDWAGAGTVLSMVVRNVELRRKEEYKQKK